MVAIGEILTKLRGSRAALLAGALSLSAAASARPQAVPADGDHEDWHPAWSPDGERIAFVRGAFPNGEVWVARPDGSEARPITDGAMAAGVPFWSPDGRRILVNAGRDGRREIYVVAPDGTGFERLAAGVDGERDRR